MVGQASCAHAHAVLWRRGGPVLLFAARHCSCASEIEPLHCCARAGHSLWHCAHPSSSSAENLKARALSPGGCFLQKLCESDRKMALVGHGSASAWFRCAEMRGAWAIGGSAWRWHGSCTLIPVPAVCWQPTDAHLWACAFSEMRFCPFRLDAAIWGELLACNVLERSIHPGRACCR